MESCIDLGELNISLKEIDIGTLPVLIERDENLYKKVTAYNGKVGNYNEKIMIKNSSFLVKENHRASFDTDVPDGKYFHKWITYNEETQEDGMKFTNLKNFNINIKDDLTLKAIFSDVPIEQIPEVYFYSTTPTKREGTDTYSFKIISSIPNNYEKVNWGIIVSSVDLGHLPSLSDVDGSDVVQSRDRSPESGTARNATKTYSLPMFENWVNEGRTVVIIVYANIKPINSEEIQTIYSDEIITIQL